MADTGGAQVQSGGNFSKETLRIETPLVVGGWFKRGGIYVYLWLIHVDVWQKPTQHCKAIILQLKINFKKFSSVLLMSKINNDVSFFIPHNFVFSSSVLSAIYWLYKSFQLSQFSLFFPFNWFPFLFYYSSYLFCL